MTDTASHTKNVTERQARLLRASGLSEEEFDRIQQQTETLHDINFMRRYLDKTEAIQEQRHQQTQHQAFHDLLDTLKMVTKLAKGLGVKQLALDPESGDISIVYKGS